MFGTTGASPASPSPGESLSRKRGAFSRSQWPSLRCPSNQDFAQSSLDRGSSPCRNPHQRCVLCCPGTTGDVFTGPQQSRNIISRGRENLQSMCSPGLKMKGYFDGDFCSDGLAVLHGRLELPAFHCFDSLFIESHAK